MQALFAGSSGRAATELDRMLWFRMAANKNSGTLRVLTPIATATTTTTTTATTTTTTTAITTIATAKTKTKANPSCPALC